MMITVAFFIQATVALAFSDAPVALALRSRSLKGNRYYFINTLIKTAASMLTPN